MGNSLHRARRLKWAVLPHNLSYPADQVPQVLTARPGRP
jgi:hypothetical protein